MKKTNIEILIILILIMNFLYTFNGVTTFASETKNRIITGKVIYSDDKSPVTNGNVKIITISKISGSIEIIDNSVIESNGVFRFVYPSLQNTDGIKIMAYPNDLDNFQSPFEPKMQDFKVASVNAEKGFDIIIEVNRTSDKSPELDNVSLKQNYPNPFNPTTLIEFNLPNTSRVSLKVYDMNGTKVATLIDNKNFLKGRNEVEFNAGNLPSGVYVYTLNASGFTEHKKMILLK